MPANDVRHCVLIAIKASWEEYSYGEQVEGGDAQFEYHTGSMAACARHWAECIVWNDNKHNPKHETDWVCTLLVDGYELGGLTPSTQEDEHLHVLRAEYAVAIARVLHVVRAEYDAQKLEEDRVSKAKELALKILAEETRKSRDLKELARLKKLYEVKADVNKE